ncbi:peptide chain release factor N(5)-glutamine methyltransferase [Aquincola sp. S2]|uniref:Release factor glutamine methyltransferase n=1 Tax=Pseudaquabacterium terrae TaxID=2732868 RepID=A0ABX2EDD7_9BURK|nr:peptide chain release factor N(5)-glutamine methyltransferase [Aquabacterium terrae]NRF66657.1 peptide chain release factor N(5)-glutamine methyltransferase [Aquabacterium terrae]
MNAAPATVRDALAAARAQGVDRLDAQLLLALHIGRPRAWLIAHDDERLSPEVAQRFIDDVQRRADSVPLAYLLGEREFHGLMLRVTPDVLDPRPDTETLVDWALELLAQPAAPAAPEVVDLGTGSGAIALAIAHRHAAAQVTATDLSDAALAVARANGERLGLALQWARGSWWSAVPGRHFDLAVSNPPYIAGNDPHLAALQHEPLLALTPGGDGLDAIRAIVAGAPAALRPGAWLLIEHGWEQAEAVCTLLRDAGFEAVQTRADLAGRPRCSGGWRSAV